MSSSSLNIEGYALFRNDYISNNVRYMHGVCTYVKKTLIVRYEEENQFVNTLSLYLPTYDMYVLTVYKPPSNRELENTSLVNFIANFCAGKEVLILGDFNLPSIRWAQDDPGATVSRSDLPFMELFNTLGLSQYVHEPTFISSGNILDLVLSSETDRVMNVQVCPPFPHCGHGLVFFQYLFQNSADSPIDRSSGQCRNWSKGNYNAIRDVLNNIDFDYEFAFKNVDEVNNFLLQTLTWLVSEFIPLRNVNVSSAPPWVKKLPKSIDRQKTALWKSYKQIRQQYGRRSHQASSAYYRFSSKYNEIRHQLTDLQAEYENDLLRQRTSKPKLFYSYIRKRKVGRPRAGPISVDGVLTDNPHTMSETFVQSFSSVFGVDNLDYPYPHQVCNGRMSVVNFSVLDVEEGLKSLKADSSMGPDSLHPYLLRECASVLAYPLHKLFTLSMNSSTLPAIWKVSNVSPIFKKGSRSDPLNYRPISLTSVSCKAMERLVAKQLYSFLEEHLILDDSQYGFRPKRSVIDQLILTYDYISYWYDLGMVVDLLLFDFAKAFDRVNHRVLLDKLYSIGIRGALLEWIRSFLCGRLMQVSIDGVLSSSKPVLSGVPQGSVLGPVLFIIFINHIGSELSSKYKMFADDMKLYLHFNKCSSNPAQFSDVVQRDINILSQTATSWGLKFAPGKSVHLQFARSRSQDNEVSTYYLDDLPIQKSKYHKDLGVTVETNLKYHKHISGIVGKAGGVASSLLRATVSRSPDFMLALLVTDIRPITDFCSPLWNLRYVGDLKQLESVQRRWTAQISGMEGLSYDSRLRRLDLYSVKGRLLRYDLIYCYRIFNGLCSLSPTDIFVMAADVGTRGHRFKILPPHSSCDARNKFFTCRVIGEWNQLPSHVVEAQTLVAFKRQLHLFLGCRLFDYAD